MYENQDEEEWKGRQVVHKLYFFYSCEHNTF